MWWGGVVDFLAGKPWFHLLFLAFLPLPTLPLSNSLSLSENVVGRLWKRVQHYCQNSFGDFRLFNPSICFQKVLPAILTYICISVFLISFRFYVSFLIYSHFLTFSMERSVIFETCSTDNPIDKALFAYSIFSAFFSFSNFSHSSFFSRFALRRHFSHLNNQTLCADADNKLSLISTALEKTQQIPYS